MIHCVEFKLCTSTFIDERYVYVIAYGYRFLYPPHLNGNAKAYKCVNKEDEEETAVCVEYEPNFMNRAI